MSGFHFGLQLPGRGLWHRLRGFGQKRRAGMPFRVWQGVPPRLLILSGSHYHNFSAVGGDPVPGWGQPAPFFQSGSAEIKLGQPGEGAGEILWRRKRVRMAKNGVFECFFCVFFFTSKFRRKKMPTQLDRGVFYLCFGVPAQFQLQAGPIPQRSPARTFSQPTRGLP